MKSSPTPCRIKPVKFVSILIALYVMWIFTSLLTAPPLKGNDPLEETPSMVPGDQAEHVRRKTAIYKALNSVRNFLEMRPQRKSYISHINKFPTWLSNILIGPWRKLYSCKELEEEGYLHLPVFSVKDNAGYVDRTKIPTMVTQMSADRFFSLERSLPLWTAPISIAVYVQYHQIKYLKEYLRPAFYRRDNLLLHFVPAIGNFYPANQLRNIALKAAQTDYVFINDADFLPSFGMHREIELDIASGFFESGPKALVVPAFSLNYGLTRPPLVKEQVKSMYEEAVSIYGSKKKQESQAATDYAHWLTTNELYQVKWSEGWEPFLVVKKTQCPLFNQRFMNNLKDKVSFVTALHYLGFRFFVHPTAFITHRYMYHPFTPSIYKTNYMKCSEKLMKRYTKYLINMQKTKNKDK